jgi:hypothetical protein
MPSYLRLMTCIRINPLATSLAQSGRRAESL